MGSSWGNFNGIFMGALIVFTSVVETRDPPPPRPMLDPPLWIGGVAI